MKEIYFVVVNLSCHRRLVWTDPKSPFALDNNHVFFSVVMWEQLHWSQCKISDDMLSTSKICAAVAKCERALRVRSHLATTRQTFDVVKGQFTPDDDNKLDTWRQSRFLSIFMILICHDIGCMLQLADDVVRNGCSIHCPQCCQISNLSRLSSTNSYIGNYRIHSWWQKEIYFVSNLSSLSSVKEPKFWPQKKNWNEEMIEKIKSHLHTDGKRVKFSNYQFLRLLASEKST